MLHGRVEDGHPDRWFFEIVLVEDHVAHQAQEADGDGEVPDQLEVPGPVSGVVVLALFVVNQAHDYATQVATHVRVEWYVHKVVHFLVPINEAFIPADDK